MSGCSLAAVVRRGSRNCYGPDGPDGRSHRAYGGCASVVSAVAPSRESELLAKGIATRSKKLLVASLLLVAVPFVTSSDALAPSSFWFLEIHAE